MHGPKFPVSVCEKLGEKPSKKLYEKPGEEPGEKPCQNNEICQKKPMHETLSTKDYNLTCDVRDNAFEKKTALSTHVELMHGANIFATTCDVHDNISVKENAFEMPKVSKHEEELCLNSCGQCGIEFIKKHDLLNHIEKVHGILTFACGICKLKFDDKCTLLNHGITEHEVIIECEHCAKTYRTSASLLLHMKVMHQIFPCAHCEDVKENKEDWMKHVMDIHGGVIFGSDLYIGNFNSEDIDQPEL